jgi:DNA-directed RNA polymerase specialized sigma24 family protein
MDALHGWLCRIAYRTALNYLRRPVLQTLTMDDEAVSAAAEAEMPTS